MAFGLVLAAAACDGATVRTRLEVTLDPDTCGAKAPADVSLACGGELGLRVLDANTLTPLTNGECIRLAPGAGTLADLPAALGRVDLGDFDPDALILLEAAYFSPATTGGCPWGALQSTEPARSRPVLDGVSEAVRGTAPRIRLELSCEPVTLPPCDRFVQDTAVEILGTRLESRDLVEPGTPELVFYVGGLLYPVVEPPNEPTYGLFNSIGNLTHQTGGLYIGQIEQAFFPEKCLPVAVTRADDALGGAPYFTCASHPYDASPVVGTAYVMDAGLAEQILTAAGIATPPAEGVIIGRITDAAGTPLTGATANGFIFGEVYYPDETFTAADMFTGTASHGYFVVSRQIGPCCDYLEGIKEGTPRLIGLSQDTTMVAGMITLVHIVATPEQ